MGIKFRKSQLNFIPEAPFLKTFHITGQYYRESWRTALHVKPELISITSFNEWHEGTQIEKAIPKRIEKFKYLDYSPKGPDYYLSLTKKFVTAFLQQKKDGRTVVL